ncbi:MAG: DUF4392 domain-containing protein [Planctomycetales bacterium]
MASVGTTDRLQRSADDIFTTAKPPESFTVLPHRTRLIFMPHSRSASENGPETGRAEIVQDIERMMQRDPARRGLLSSKHASSTWMTGQLAPAGENLARGSGGVAIVTGFYIPHGTPPAAETDGPRERSCWQISCRSWGDG